MFIIRLCFINYFELFCVYDNKILVGRGFNRREKWVGFRGGVDKGVYSNLKKLYLKFVYGDI